MLARELPTTMLESLAARLESSERLDSDAREAALGALTNTATRRRAADVLDLWASHDLGSTAVLAGALRAAHAADAWHRQRQHLELVWTGPVPSGTELRRTDQALLELVRGATTSMLIVSFAAYRVPAVHDALLAAARRGVALEFVFEHPETGKIDHDPVLTLGAEIAAASTLWEWPIEQRPRDDRGRHGTLHAKLALADRRRLFVSSANFTGDALFLNMELGVLIEGGDLPGEIAAHFEALVRDGALRRV